jgi:hypothetical protein
MINIQMMEFKVEEIVPIVRQKIILQNFFIFVDIVTSDFGEVVSKHDIEMIIGVIDETGIVGNIIVFVVSLVG